ncbi:WD40-repeat-containing domain protein [Cladochytrium replicatum]|nr:WD40-repeat-containing domain protein [Cladochytrium replicatum]
MAMEYRQTIADAHPKPILCVQYNPWRREIYTGGEVLFSVGLDGNLIVWGPSGKILQKLQTDDPIYSIAFNLRRQQILVGCSKKVRLFQVTSNDDTTAALMQFEVLERRSVCNHDHSDIVSCIVSCEGRFYSAGYDRKIIIYDTTHHGVLRIKVASVINNAHEAAISCMVYGKDADNSWLITGSFDRIVKLWSLDGNLLQRFDGFSDTITSLCYVLPTQTLWITAMSSVPIVYDPRSGVNVSDFVSTDNAGFHQHNGPFCFRQLVFVPDANEVLGITNRRSVAIWRFNPTAPLTVLTGHTDVVETLTFTSKEPLLIFSGGGDGAIRKWERLQLNTFMYSQESLGVPKEEKREEQVIFNSYAKKPEERRKLQAALHRRISQRLEMWQRSLDDDTITGGKSKGHSGGSKQLELMSSSAAAAFRRKEQQDLGSKERRMSRSLDEWKGTGLVKASRPGVVSMKYYEDLDLLISGYEDSKIYVWGYNEEAFKCDGDDIEREKEAHMVTENGISNDSVSNRVAGMTLKFILQDHKQAVTGLACFFRDGVHWLLTTGWDRRICLWDVKHGRLHDVVRHNGFSMMINATPAAVAAQYASALQAATSGLPASLGGLAALSIPNLFSASSEELAADGIILDLDYSAERNEFGYVSADRMGYIRRFSTKGDEMTLVAVLQGHEAEVTQIKWNRFMDQWVTGSDDRTIRIWPAEGIPCLKVINNDSGVTALCVDVMNGCIITGSQDKMIRVFDTEKKDECVQKNIGHHDEVRTIIHIPVRNQYVSASWDNTLRIWNAYLKKGQRRLTTKAAYNPTVGVFDDLEENFPKFSELNPLVVPATIPKGIFVKDAMEKPSVDDSMVNRSMEQSRLEDDLRFTLSGLESALHAQEKTAGSRRLRDAPMIKRPALERKKLEVVEAVGR